MTDLAQRDEAPTITSIVTDSFPNLRIGALRDFLNIMKGHGYYKDIRWNKTNSIYTFETGSVIEFFSINENPEKGRGGRRDRLFINECNRIPFASFEELEVRTREFVFVDWNPSEEFWYYTNVKGRRDDVEEIVLTYLDNEALDEESKRSILQRRDRRQWWLVYGLGQLGEVEGRIYTGWKPITQIPHEARLIRRGLDFGYSNDPTAIIDIYSYNGGFIFDEQLYQKGMHNKPIADFILNLDEPQTLVVADCAEPKSIDEIRSYGVNIIAVKKGKNSVKQGIDYIQSQRISYTERSFNLKKEFFNYLWEKDKTGKSMPVPQEGFDHLLDAARYGFDRYKQIEKRISYQQPAYEPISDYEFNANRQPFRSGILDESLNPDSDIERRINF